MVKAKKPAVKKKKKKASKTTATPKPKPQRGRKEDLRTDIEIEAANKQIDAFLDSLKVDQRWLTVRARQQRVDRDTLLGVPVDEYVTSYHTVLSMELIRKIAALVRDGSSLNTAARSVGVSMGKLREWVAHGYKKPDTLYGALVAVLDQANALAEANAVSSLYNGKRGWRSSLAYLEQRPMLLEKDVFVVAQEEAEREEASKAHTVLDVDKAALVMALLESAAPAQGDSEDAASNVVDIKVTA